MRVDLIKALSLAGRGGSITNRCGAGAGPAYDPRRGLIYIYIYKYIYININIYIYRIIDYTDSKYDNKTNFKHL